MVIRGFSKIENVVDEDDEVEQVRSKSEDAYNKAHEEYQAGRKSKADILKLFQNAEVTMEPLMQNGLAGLPLASLEMVLKGRLHQAVLMAQIADFPGRWQAVRDLTEQILQYDMTNCHAHYLRGLALRHGFQMKREATDALRKAVTNAKQQGKTADLEQWRAGVEDMLSLDPTSAEEELKALFNEQSESEPKVGPTRAERSEGVEASPAAAAAPPGAASTPSLKRGFLNPQRKRPSGKTEAAASAAAAPADRPPLPKPSAAPEENKELGSSKEGELQEQKRLLEEKCRQLEETEQELGKLRGQLHRTEEEKKLQLQELKDRLHEAEESSARQLEAQSLQLEEWQHELCEQLGTLSAEIEETVSNVAGQGSCAEGPGAGELEAVREVAAKTQEDLEASRKWAEGEQQRLADLATEAATVREMAGKELREREEASRQQIAEVKELVSRIGQLKATAKTLREQVKQKTTLEEQHAELEKDVGQLSDQIAAFKALPASAKASAMLRDGSTQLVVVFAFLLGLLLMLGILGEWLRPKCCGLGPAR